MRETCKNAFDVVSDKREAGGEPSSSELAALDECIKSSILGLRAYCGDIFAALAECNPQLSKVDSRECAKLRKALKQCAVENKLGELA